MKTEHDVKHRSSNFMGSQPFQINPFLNANLYIYGFKHQRNTQRKHEIMILIIAKMHISCYYLYQKVHIYEYNQKSYLLDMNMKTHINRFSSKLLRFHMAKEDKDGSVFHSLCHRILDRIYI